MSKTSTRASCGDPGKPQGEPGRSRARISLPPGELCFVRACSALTEALSPSFWCPRHRRSRRACAHLDPRPSPLPAPSREGRRVATNRDTFHRRGELSPLPGSAARKPLVPSRSRFAACGFPRTARPPSATPATTGATSDGQAPPADFCNQSRRTGTTSERPLLERTPLGALSVARTGGLPRRRASSGREQALCRPNHSE
jgi:hypothetical protein